MRTGNTTATGTTWALAILAALVGCGGIPTDPTPSRGDELIVDVHAHAFTALHLPISGLVAAYSGGDERLGRLVERLALLQSEEECEAGPGGLGDLPDQEGCEAWLAVARAGSPLATGGADELSGEALDELAEEGFDAVWRCRVELATRGRLSQAEAEAIDAELDALLDYALGVIPEPPASLAGVPLDFAGRAVDTISPVDLRAQLEQYVILVWTLTRSHETVADCLRVTYPAADLSIPYMMDMQRWFPDDDDVCRPLQTQIDDMLGVMTSDEHLGRVHAFLPYDPRRDIEESGRALALVKEYLPQGFVGVKVYPPLGYRASGNDADITGEGDDPPDRERYDAALDALFAWCAQEDVPVAAHCNPTGAESADGRGRRSHPKYWRAVLERHPDLRLNLGHFGGHDLGVRGGWSDTIGELMQTYPNVYADIAYHDFPMSSDTLVAWHRFFDRYPKAGRRLMFGSDWPMVLRETYGHEYLSTYLQIFETAFPEARERVFGKNALRYLGLTKPSKNRARLEAFYDGQDEGFRPSRWWAFTDESGEE